MNESLWAADSALQETARATDSRAPLGRKQLVAETKERFPVIYNLEISSTRVIHLE